jgi:hypothetical protein
MSGCRRLPRAGRLSSSPDGGVSGEQRIRLPVGRWLELHPFRRSDRL